MCSFGWEGSSHPGRCPQVTKWMVRTQGAFFSMQRNQYRKVSQSRKRSSELSEVAEGSYFARSARQAGSEPSTQGMTMSIG